MMRPMRRLILLCLLLAACQPGDASVQTTLMAENRAYVTEAAAIRATVAARQTSVLRDAYAMETEAAEINSVNAQVLQTVVAGNPPTVQLVVRANPTQGIPGVGEGVFGTGDAMIMEDAVSGDAAGRFVDVVVASDIQQADGCALDVQTGFPTGVESVYAVARVQDLPAGTTVGIDWSYAGALSVQNNWTSEFDESEICVWFSLQPYSEGPWTARFTSNGVPVGNEVAFTVGG